MKKILIVEDDKSIARLQKDYLEINDYQVIIEREGNIATILKLLNEVDMVILDLMLPENSGYDICREIRAVSDKPILIISAMDGDNDIVLGLGLGADDYIRKPFSPNELVARVKSQFNRFDRLTNSNDTENKNMVEVRGLVVDKDSQTCTIGGVEIELTPKEFEIVLLLASNLGRVFSKNEIYERIWNFDSLGDANTISVHVRRIREKLEVDSSNPVFIETIWGVGYKMKK